MGTAFVWLVNQIIGLLIIAIFAQFIVNLLITFDIINLRNRFVAGLSRTLDAIVNPLLRPIQRILPILGGVDLSPIVLLLILQFIRIAFNISAAPLIQSALG